MNPKSNKMKILWSVDAFDDLYEVREKTVRVFQRFAQSRQLQVDPVYVLSPALLGIANELSEPSADVYAPMAKKAVSQMLKNLEIPGLQAPEVLTHFRGPLRASAELLSNLALKGSYDLIVTGSHGRKGLQRMILGSFAEELLLRAHVPVLVVGDHSEEWKAQLDKKPLHILLANDLSAPHSPLFDEVFQTAVALGAKVTLLNAIPRPVEPVFQSGVYLLSGGWVPARVYLDKEHARQKKTAEQIVSFARQSYDVPVEFIIDDNCNSVTDSILKNSEKIGAGFIAMTAESGPVASALIGSITRQIVRSAPCPVWVYRGKDKA